MNEIWDSEIRREAYFIKKKYSRDLYEKNNAPLKTMDLSKESFENGIISLWTLGREK